MSHTWLVQEQVICEIRQIKGKKMAMLSIVYVIYTIEWYNFYRKRKNVTSYIIINILNFSVFRIGVLHKLFKKY